MARGHTGQHSGGTESDLVSGLKRALASAKAGQRSFWSRFRTFQVCPRISPNLSGRLSLQQPTAWDVGRLVVIAGAEGPKRGRSPVLDVRRRDFITLLGGAVAAWPLAARAQQAGKVPTIGYLGGGAPISQRAWLDAFVQRLRELGWIEGRTVAIEYRWGEGRTERFAEIAAEFVRLKVDVILAGGTEAAVAAKQATSMIPIVFPSAGDPVGSRLVDSLARPGGNVTGLSNLGSGLAAKRLELLREVFPELRRLAVMVNADYSGGVTERDEMDEAARTLGLELIPFPIRRVEDIASAFEGLKGRAEGLYTIGDSLVHVHRLRINTFALAARLPTMFSQREFVEAAGLMSYGTNFPDLNRRAAEYVDKILRGAKPGDLPVQQPTKFDLVINLTTAKALGLTIPESFLTRADEVIE
jgi:putative tryptophan/tyrosine transport system substrate-binding protein